MSVELQTGGRGGGGSIGTLGWGRMLESTRRIMIEAALLEKLWRVSLREELMVRDKVVSI